MCRVCMHLRVASKAFMEVWATLTKYSSKQQTEEEQRESSKAAFDVQYFKAQLNKFPVRAIQITMQMPEQRSMEELELLLCTLRSLLSIRHYSKSYQLLLAKIMRYERFRRRRVIMKKGHSAHSFYFIYSGGVSFTTDEDGSSAFKEEQQADLRKGARFGEIPVLKGLRRNFTAVCMEDTELLVVDKEDFFENRLDQVLVEESHRRFIFFRSLKLLDSLPDSSIEVLSDYSTTEEFLYGQVIPYNMDNLIFVTKGRFVILRLVDLTQCPSYHKFIVQELPFMKNAFQKKESFGENEGKSTLPILVQSAFIDVDKQRRRPFGPVCLCSRSRAIQLDPTFQLLVCSFVGYGTSSAYPNRFQIDRRLLNITDRRGSIHPQSNTSANISKHKFKPLTLTRSQSRYSESSSVQSRETYSASISHTPTLKTPSDSQHNMKTRSEIWRRLKPGSSTSLSKFEDIPLIMGKPIRKSFASHHSPIPKALAVAVYMKIDSFLPGEVFGLRQYFEANNLKDKRDFNIKSQGTKIVRIDMQTFSEITDRQTLQKVRKLRSIYPSDDELCDRFIKNNFWKIFKRNMIAELTRKSHRFLTIGQVLESGQGEDVYEIDKTGILNIPEIANNRSIIFSKPSYYVAPVTRTKEDGGTTLPKLDLQLIHGIAKFPSSINNLLY
ncbi:cyclic nucleotide-binding domain-containing protein 2-like [Heterodontus francisci]|uniref:cyclic nucleotide-binding domain-containing protein 2-like n=1 Tax=Heterodontus francisci TaxID=7792 RepID=UPI00355B3B65